MRQLIDLLNTFAGSAARLQSGLPAAPAAPPFALAPPLSRAAAAAHPALAAAEAALAAKLADGAAVASADYESLGHLNSTLGQLRGFAAAEARRELNRYCDVLPYDDNRVRLNPPSPPGSPTCSGAGGCSSESGSGSLDAADYINASPLRSAEGDVPWEYIAAQGPLRHTREAFWQMVLEEGAGAVVMLTNIVERGVPKCARYFPEGPRTSKLLGRYLVSTRSMEQLLPDLHRRSVSVREAGSGDAGGGGSAAAGSRAGPSRAVQHYHFTAWPDHGVPASPEPLLALCEALRRRGAHASPIVVHCSAGIGRSGVFVVLDVVTRRLLRLLGCPDGATGAAAVDVAALVADLRRQRLGMVQTREQYLFCHLALLHFVRQLAAEGVAPDSARAD